MVREVTTALRGRPAVVPVDRVWPLLAESRPDLRRAGYRLIQVRGLVEQLRVALLLATDPEPSLARRAVADATRIARHTTVLPWQRLPRPALDVTAEQRADLIRLTSRAADTLGPETTTMVHT